MGLALETSILVVDLGKGHVCALNAIERKCGLAIYNLCTGHGYSVLDIVKAFERTNGVKVSYQIMPCRTGDITICCINHAKAKNELGWEAQFSIDEMCHDS